MREIANLVPPTDFVYGAGLFPRGMIQVESPWQPPGGSRKPREGPMRSNGIDLLGRNQGSAKQNKGQLCCVGKKAACCQELGQVLAVTCNTPYWTQCPLFVPRPRPPRIGTFNAEPHRAGPGCVCNTVSSTTPAGLNLEPELSTKDAIEPATRDPGGGRCTRLSDFS